MFGTHPFKREPFSGILADVRFYTRPLNASSIMQVYTTDSAVNDFIPMVVLPEVDRQLPEGVSISGIHNSVLRETPPKDIWLYINEKLTYEKASNICVTYGGNMLNLEKESTDKIYDFKNSEIMDVILELWVQSSGNSCNMTSFSAIGMVVGTQNCDSVFKTICVINKTVVYRLIGMRDSIVYEFTLIPEMYRFEAEYDYSVVYSATRKSLQLKHTFSKQTFALTKGTKISGIMGRQMWSELGPDQEHFLMTLTKCTKDQFTCSNGLCVSLSNVCDFEADCSDFTDEYHCNITQSRPTYYNSKLSGEQYLNVSLQIMLFRIISLDNNDETLRIEIGVVSNWKDSRVVFHNIHPDWKTLVDCRDIKYYWQPNIMLQGVINEHRSALSMAQSPGDMYITAHNDGKASIFKSQEGKQK